MSKDKDHKLIFVSNGAALIPGIVRMRDAPYYLGMNKTFFRDVVQPYLTRIPIAKKGIGFSRLELDRWIAYTQATLGQPPEKSPPWEDSEKTAPFPQTNSSSKKTPVKKYSPPGSPTSADLQALVRKTMTHIQDK